MDFKRSTKPKQNEIRESLNPSDTVETYGKHLQDRRAFTMWPFSTFVWNHANKWGSLGGSISISYEDGFKYAADITIKAVWMWSNNSTPQWMILANTTVWTNEDTQYSNTAQMNFLFLSVGRSFCSLDSVFLSLLHSAWFGVDGQLNPS